MNTELLLSAVTYRQGNISLNNSFSGTANFNGIALKTVVGGAYAFNLNDGFLAVSIAPGSTITLPTLTNGRMITVKNANNSTPTISVITAGGKKIDGVVPPYVLFPGESVTFIGTGENWYIIGKVY